MSSNMLNMTQTHLKHAMAVQVDFKITTVRKTFRQHLIDQQL